MKWKDRLKKAKKIYEKGEDSPFSDVDVDLAESYSTCAVSESPISLDYITDNLYDLGEEFDIAVRDQDYKEAKKIYDLIQEEFKKELNNV